MNLNSNTHTFTYTHTQQRGEAAGGTEPSAMARIVALSVSVDPTAEHDLQSFTSRFVDGNIMLLLCNCAKIAGFVWIMM